MRMRTGLFALAAAGLLASAAPVDAQSLRGSTRSMDRQERQARAHDFTYLRSPTQVRRFAEQGYLVPIVDQTNFWLKDVSFPYARPEVKLFIERLSAQYRAACGERLVVTSLTRPRSRQPRNASTRSVHPTGMAVDLRRSSRPSCRRWLEDVLLSLEERRVLEATRERRPAHYHVALFPQPYRGYVDQLIAAQRTASADQGSAHRVRAGETLWAIAQNYDTTVRELRALNGLRGSRIYAGQTLKVPVAP